MRFFQAVGMILSSGVVGSDDTVQSALVVHNRYRQQVVFGDHLRHITLASSRLTLTTRLCMSWGHWSARAGQYQLAQLRTRRSAAPPHPSNIHVKTLSLLACCFT